MQVDKSRYEEAHGKSPSGYGYWGFDVTLTDGTGRYTFEESWAYGNFTQARKDAVKKAESMVNAKAVAVVVLP